MLTVVIPTFNNEKSIEMVLRAAKRISDTVLVIDSFSTDATLDIARKHGAKVYERKYHYSADQKNWVLDKVVTEWAMVIDSDELLSEELIEEIWRKKAAVTVEAEPDAPALASGDLEKPSKP